MAVTVQGYYRCCLHNIIATHIVILQPVVPTILLSRSTTTEAACINSEKVFNYSTCSNYYYRHLALNRKQINITRGLFGNDWNGSCIELV